MAMTKCRECGESVSTEADDCPHCGCENPSKSRHWGRIIGGWVVVLGLLVFVVNMLPELTSLDDPPLSIVTRDSLVGEGKVFIITNTSDQPLHECTLMLEAQDGKTYGPKVFATTMAPHKSMEIGWLELGNWTPSPGQTVEMTCADFGDIKGRL